MRFVALISARIHRVSAEVRTKVSMKQLSESQQVFLNFTIHPVQALRENIKIPNKG